jgi:hypothetical protein
MKIFMTFGTWRWWCQPQAPAAFTPRKSSWYSFSLQAKNTTLKNPPGIDFGTVRLVAQPLNHYGTPGPPPGQVLKEYGRTEAMGVVTVVIICTAVERKQNLLCWLPRSTDRSCVCLTSVWQFPVSLGKQVVLLNITVTHSDPNTGVAYRVSS